MSCFDNEIKKTISDIKQTAEDGDLRFCLLGDSHMSDEGEDTRRNISAVDAEVGFDFIVHAGNIINGEDPKNISARILTEETEKYRNSIKSRKIFVTQGDGDGWRDETFVGQLAEHIMSDEFWYSCTGFIDAYGNVFREGNKPYYFVDLPDTRLIFLCSYFYHLDEKYGLYEKYTGIDILQQKWLKTKALCGCEGKTVLLFSHRIPNSRFETGKDPFEFLGRSTDPVTAIIQNAQNNGVNIACLFGSGYGFDSKIITSGINIVVMGPQLAKSADRKLKTAEQDLWSAVVVKKKEQKIYIFRFGAGEDMVI